MCCFNRNSILDCIFTPFIHRIASEWPWLTPFPQKVYELPFGKNDSAINLFNENAPGSHPQEIKAI